MEIKENNIEFLTGEKTATITLSNQKYINRIKKIYAKRKDEFDYLVENADGSICARIPLKWIKINAGSDPTKPKRELSPEQMAKMKAALTKYREEKKLTV